MVVKCIESSFKRKTKSGVTNDNNKELEELLLPFDSAFPLQSHISMAGRFPASTQEREISVVMRGCPGLAQPATEVSYLLLSHCLTQPLLLVRDPLPQNPVVNLADTLLKSGLARALFSAVSFLFYSAKHGKSPSMALEVAVGSPVNIMSLVRSCFLGVSGYFAKTFCMTKRAWNYVDTRVGNDGSDCFPT